MIEVTTTFKGEHEDLQELARDIQDAVDKRIQGDTLTVIWGRSGPRQEALDHCKSCVDWQLVDTLSIQHEGTWDRPV